MNSRFYREYSCRDLFHKPLSPHLLYKTLEFRSGVPLPRSFAGMSETTARFQAINCLEKILRKAVAEPLFLLVAVACVVEGVARMIIYTLAAIPLLLSEYCLPGAFDACIESGSDALFSMIHIPALCVVGFVKSPFVCAWIDIDDLDMCR
ncbi:MAG: hypothetical protein ACHQT8_00330 [Chlamydiales bacterium]